MMGNQIFELFWRFDSITFNHSARVYELAREYEDHYKFSDRRLSRAALVHDLGKVYISPRILDKIGSLSGLERELVNLHPYIGYCLLKDEYVDEDICRIVLYHHGTDPLVIAPVKADLRDDIVELASILRSIDAFEALTSDRPYHRGLPVAQAIEALKCDNITHHTEVLKFFERMEKERDFYRSSAVFRGSYTLERDSINELLGTY